MSLWELSYFDQPRNFFVGQVSRSPLWEGEVALPVWKWDEVSALNALW